MTAFYRPGALAAWIAADALVITDVEHAATLRALRADPSAPSALSVISALSGGDLRHVPDFVAVLVEGESLRVVVRGPYVVTAGSTSITGEGVATWVEHLVGSTEHVQIGDGNEAQWPVEAGLVLVDSVIWSPATVPPMVDGPMVDGPMVVADPPQKSESDLPAESTPELIPESEPGPTPGPVDPFATRTEDDDVFDEMFGATIYGRRPEDAAVRESAEPAPTMVQPPPGAAEATPPAAPPATPTVAPSVESLGDHDGRTMTFAQLQELRRRSGAGSSEPEPQPEPPASRRPQVTLSVAGQEVVCDRTVLMGRSPRTEQASSADLPIIVVIDDPYVSSTHLEVSFSEDAPVATDRSTNGTLLSRDGAPPERIPKGIPVVLSDRSVLMLSEDVSVTVRIEA